ncbi:MAG: glycosyltransferase [Chlamydiae bacterium]|nr:glycosyltransferase [Chlamydiota bacterium]MBI3266518.1 glycosyltransferase [Chlamydiota bacterium]
MQDFQEKISILMPAYNEAGHIGKNVLETQKSLEEIGVKNYEIIVIDDGSQDGTYEAALKVSKDGVVLAKKARKNHGKGRALRYGFRFATGDHVVFLDSDLDLHPRQIRLLLDIMRENDADIVVGSKRHAASVLQRYPKRRRIISYFYNLIVRILFASKISDTQTGLKLFKKKVLDDIFHRVLVKRFAFDVELLMVAHHLGYKIVDAPVVLDFNRPHRMGRVRVRDILRTWQDTLAVFYRLYWKKTYLKSRSRFSRNQEGAKE